MATTTKKATFDDIPVLVELMHEFYAESDYPLDQQWAAASFSALLADDSRGAAWIILENGEPAGHVVLTIRFSMEHGGLVGFIDDLFIRPAYRGKGLGKALLQAVFEESARRNLLALHLEVDREDTRAKSLYAKFGLVPRQPELQLLSVQFGKAAGEV